MEAHANKLFVNVGEDRVVDAFDFEVALKRFITNSNAATYKRNRMVVKIDNYARPIFISSKPQPSSIDNKSEGYVITYL